MVRRYAVHLPSTLPQRQMLRRRGFRLSGPGCDGGLPIQTKASKYRCHMLCTVHASSISLRYEQCRDAQAQLTKLTAHKKKKKRRRTAERGENTACSRAGFLSNSSRRSARWHEQFSCPVEAHLSANHCCSVSSLFRRCYRTKKSWSSASCGASSLGRGVFQLAGEGFSFGVQNETGSFWGGPT